MMLAALLILAMAVFHSAYAAECKPQNCGDVQCFQRKPKSATFDMYTSGGKARARCEFSKTSNTSKPKTMFLHRDNASLRFHSRTWREYVDGFSDKSGGRMWMGLENAHRLTLNSTMRLHVVMRGANGTTGSIQYPRFRVFGATYTYGFSYQPPQHAKKTGDSFTIGYPFSAPYHDLTNTKCATNLKTGGWFATNRNPGGQSTICTEANLFGRYTQSNESDALSWNSFNRPIHSLKMYFLMSAAKPCVNPCQHDSVCIHNEASDTDSCTCAEGFFGHNCEYVDPCIDGRSICKDKECFGNYGDGSFRCEYRKFCHLGVCKNGATCVDDGGNYTCTCPHAFKGINCSERICDNFTCHNGGTCLPDPKETDSAKCECYAGYGGLHCEDRLGCWTNPCQNSGSCVNEVGEDTFRCMCTQGFSGKLCDVEEGGTTSQVQRLLSVVILIILGAVGIVLWVYAIMYCIRVRKSKTDDEPVPADGKRRKSVVRRKKRPSEQSDEGSLWTPKYDVVPPVSPVNKSLAPPTKKPRKSLSPSGKKGEGPDGKKSEGLDGKKGEGAETKKGEHHHKSHRKSSHRKKDTMPVHAHPRRESASFHPPAV